MFSTAVAILRFAYLNSHFFFFKIQTLDRCRPFFLFWSEYQCIGDSRILIGSVINLSVCACVCACTHISWPSEYLQRYSNIHKSNKVHARERYFCLPTTTSYSLLTTFFIDDRSPLKVETTIYLFHLLLLLSFLKKK